MVNGWAIAHGRDGLPVDYLPPDGVVVEVDGEPVAAGWLYKSVGVGVAFLEHVHTRPRMTLKASRKAINLVIAYFQFNAREDDYGVILAHTTSALAREAVGMGFEVTGADRVAIAMRTGLAERRAA